MHSQVHVLTALKPGGGLYCTQRVCAHASVLALSLLMGAAVVRFLYIKKKKKRGEKKKALSKQTPW